MRKIATILFPLLLVLVMGTGSLMAQEDLDSSEEVTQIRGSVYYQSSEDPLENTSLTGVIVVSEDEEAAIYVRCQGEAGLDVFIASGEYLGDGTRPVRWRFDDEGMKQGIWGISTDGQGVFVPEGRYEDFLVSMKEHNQLAVGITDYDQTEQTYVFQLAGFSDAMARDMPCVAAPTE